MKAVKGRLDGLLSGFSFHLLVDVFPVAHRDNHYFFSLIVDMTNYPVVPDPVSPVLCKVSCKSFSGIEGFRGKSDHVHQVGDFIVVAAVDAETVQLRRFLIEP